MRSELEEELLRRREGRHKENMQSRWGRKRRKREDSLKRWRGRRRRKCKDNLKSFGRKRRHNDMQTLKNNTKSWGGKEWDNSKRGSAKRRKNNMKMCEEAQRWFEETRCEEEARRNFEKKLEEGLALFSRESGLTGSNDLVPTILGLKWGSDLSLAHIFPTPKPWAADSKTRSGCCTQTRRPWRRTTSIVEDATMAWTLKLEASRTSSC